MLICKIYIDQELKKQYELAEAKLRSKCDEEVKMIEKSKDCLINMFDNERKIFTDEIKELKEKLEQQTKEVVTLRQQNRELDLERRTVNTKMISFAEKANNTLASTIVNNYTTNHNNNHVQLQHFNPSLLIGHIKPPDVVIRSVQQLVNHIMSLGFSNFYRISDRARKSVLWYNQDGKEIKDSNCSMIAKEVIKTLQPELIQQKAYLEQEQTIQNSLPPSKQDNTKLAELSENLYFTTSLIQEQPQIMKSLQSELGSRAKNKNDASIDLLKLKTYNKFIYQVQSALLPKMKEWIGLEPKALGEYLATKLKGFFFTEGSSTNVENPNILIKDDEGKKQLVKMESFINILIESLKSILDSEVFSVVKELALDDTKIDIVQAKQTFERIEQLSQKHTRKERKDRKEEKVKEGERSESSESTENEESLKAFSSQIVHSMASSYRK